MEHDKQIGTGNRRKLTAAAMTPKGPVPACHAPLGYRLSDGRSWVLREHDGCGGVFPGAEVLGFLHGTNHLCGTDVGYHELDGGAVEAQVVADGVQGSWLFGFPITDGVDGAA